MQKIYIIGAVIIIALGALSFIMTPQNTHNDTGTTNVNTEEVATSTPSGGEEAQETTTDKAEPATTAQGTTAVLKTSKGDIVIELNAQDAPATVANFVKLVQAGFYTGVKFHRVIPGFMIQGGDPLTKDDSQQARWGTGGPGYTFADEIHANNRNTVGTISMANAGPNTNGSQFFINVANNNFLDTKHTVFGTVTQGMDVVTAIEETPTAEQDRPVTPITILSVTIK